MSPDQIHLYWREWSKVRKTDPTADRHALHRAALGEDKSSKALTNLEFDAVLKEFWAISKPNDVGAQLRQIRMGRTRLLWRIQHDQSDCLQLYGRSPGPYIESLVVDKFGVRDLGKLNPRQLSQVRDTLASRIGAMRRQAGHTVAEMQRLARTAAPAPEALGIDANHDFAAAEAAQPLESTPGRIPITQDTPLQA